MASAVSIASCIKCLSGSAQVVCGGCQQWLCLKHFAEHRQDFAEQLDYLAQQHNQIRRQSLQTNGEDYHPLVARIDQWEKKSIERIQQVADEVRQRIRKLIDENERKFDESLQNLATALQESRGTENYTEVNLNRWMDELNKLQEHARTPLGLTIIHDQDDINTSIRLIQLRVKQMKGPALITPMSKWSKIGRTIVGRCGLGDGLNQLHYPFGIHIDHDGTMFISDSDNHRILRWKPYSHYAEIIIGREGRGDRTNQLDLPAALLFDRSKNCLIVSEYGNRRVMRWSFNQNDQSCDDGEVLISDIVALGLAIDDEGSLYVSDYERHEVRRYERDDPSGVIVAGGYGQGSALHQLQSPRHIFMDQDFSLYISDSDNHRVMRWIRNAREGIVVAGGHGQGNSLEQLNRPSGTFVDGMGSVYVLDQRNSRVMRWTCGSSEGVVIIGDDGYGSQKNQLHQPASMSIDQKGNLHVVDTSNHRIQCFDLLPNSF